jgi:Flp pilus assembly protein TadG
VAKALQTHLSAFRRNQDGAVGMILGLAAVPLVMLVATAVDIGRGMHMNQKYTDAIDSATLAAAKLIKEGQASDAEVKATALAYFKANVTGNYGVFNDSDFNVIINRGDSKIEIVLPAYVPTTFARVGGIDRININQKSSAVFALRDIEVGLALDVTGSMGSSPKSGGKPKIDTLKSAVTKFAELMLPDNPLPGQKIRLGLAPYSASINLGTFAKTASNNRSKDDCVTERTTSAKYSDASVQTGGYFTVAADGKADTDDTEGYAGTNKPGTAAYACPKAVIMPLTSDRKALIDSVNDYKEGGWTAGHFGVQWGWNLVSPEWASTWGGTSQPDLYSKVASKRLVKAVILMTDGVFNTAYQNNETSAKQAIRLCDEMKAKGVQVFAIAFDAPPAAKATLEACATPGSDYYADATNEADLDQAFAAFAGKINALRLAQ